MRLWAQKTLVYIVVKISLGLGLTSISHQTYASCSGTPGVNIVADSGSACVATETIYTSTSGQITFDAQTNSSITASNDLTVNASGNANALNTQAGATINILGKLTVSNTGDNASTLATDGGNITINGLATLSTTGDNSFGAIVNASNGASQIKLDGGAHITTTGSSHGLITLLIGNITVSSPLTVQTHGARAFGATAFYSNQASINFNSTVNINATGSGSSNTNFLNSGPGGLAALLGGVVTANDHATIQATGNYTTALNSFSGTMTLNQGANIMLSGSYSNGIWVADGRAINNLMRNVVGFAADSPNANDPGVLTLKGNWQVITTDVTSHGIHLSGADSQLSITDSSSSGIVQTQGTAIRFDSENSMTLDQRDSGGTVIPGGYGIAKRSTGLRASLVNTTITSAAGNVIEIAGVGKNLTSGENSRLTLSSSSAAANNGLKLLNIGSQTIEFFNPNTSQNETSTFTTDGFDFVANRSTLSGDIIVSADSQNINLFFQQGTQFTGMIDPANLTIDTSSTWYLTNNSLINTLNHAGAIISQAPTSTTFLPKTLTLNNLVGQNGTITLNTDFTGVSDQIIIDGGTVTGVTALAINNVGNSSAALSNTIPIVTSINGGTIPAGSFILNGRVAVGAYTYTLQNNGTTLSNTSTSTTGAILPNYRQEVPVDMVTQALASRLSLALLGNYRIRTSQTSSSTKSWGRVLGVIGKVNPTDGNFSTRGPSYNFNLTGFQLGKHLYHRSISNHESYTAGVYLGISSANSWVNSAYDSSSAGKLSMQAYTLGTYWTRQTSKQWYTDIVMQASRYANIHGQSSSNEEMKTNGWGTDVAIENGISIALSQQLALEPQLQLIYQFQKINSTQDSFGKIDYGRLHATYARIGTRLTKNREISSQPANAYLGLHIWSNLSGQGKTTFSTLLGKNPVNLNTDLGGTWGQVELGFSGKISKYTSFLLAADYNQSIDSNANRSFAGRFGLNNAW